jgi:hypothetical protein
MQPLPVVAWVVATSIIDEVQGRFFLPNTNQCSNCNTYGALRCQFESWFVDLYPAAWLSLMSWSIVGFDRRQCADSLCNAVDNRVELITSIDSCSSVLNLLE